MEIEDSAGSGDRPRLLHVSAEHGGNEETDRLHRRAKSAFTFYSFNSLHFLQFYLLSKKCIDVLSQPLLFTVLTVFAFYSFYSFTVLFVLKKIDVLSQPSVFSVLKVVYFYSFIVLKLSSVTVFYVLGFKSLET